jgi:hypothetical protein
MSVVSVRWTASYVLSDSRSPIVVLLGCDRSRIGALVVVIGSLTLSSCFFISFDNDSASVNYGGTHWFNREVC